METGRATEKRRENRHGDQKSDGKAKRKQTWRLEKQTWRPESEGKADVETRKADVKTGKAMEKQSESRRGDRKSKVKAGGIGME